LIIDLCWRVVWTVLPDSPVGLVQVFQDRLMCRRAVVALGVTSLTAARAIPADIATPSSANTGASKCDLGSWVRLLTTG